MQSAFQIDIRDNVATALEELEPGPVCILGEATEQQVMCTEKVPKGHKLAIKPLSPEEDVIKYGVRIGRANQAIPAGVWVHLHNIHSVYDERSSHLDVHTGAPKDIKYE